LEASIIMCSSALMGRAAGITLLPLFLSLYFTPFFNVIGSFRVVHHQYDDDARLFIVLSRFIVHDRVDLLKNCLASIHAWLRFNVLQLNPTKCEVIQFTATFGCDWVATATSIESLMLYRSSHGQPLWVLELHLSINYRLTLMRKIYARYTIVTSETLHLTIFVELSPAARLDYCNYFLGL